MPASTENPRKKLGRPPRDTDQINFRVDREVIHALDAFASEQAAKRPEAVRRILRDWLEGHGYLKPCLRSSAE